MGKRTTAGRRRLGQLLLERGWINGEQLIRAVQSQRAVGGRIGTCLLEMDAVSEDRLLEALAEQLGVPPVRIEQLRTIAEDTLQLVPATLAVRYRTVPFEVSTGELRIAALNVSDLEQLDAIAFCTDKRVRPHIANEARLFEALERFYGIECPQRYGHLLDRLNRTRYLWNVADSDQPVEEELDPLGMPTVKWMRPDEVFGPLIEPSSQAAQFGSTRAASTRAAEPAGNGQPARARDEETAEQPTPPTIEAGADVASPTEPTPSHAPTTGAKAMPLTPQDAVPNDLTGSSAEDDHRNTKDDADNDPLEVTAIIDDRVPLMLTPPQSLADVARDLAAQQDPAGIADVLLSFLSGPFVRCGLLRSARGELRGWKAVGPDLREEDFSAVSVPRERLVAAEVREGAAAPRTIESLDATVAACWAEAPRAGWIAVPVCLKDRVVCAIIGHRDGRATPPRLLAQLEELACKVALALELCILRKKILGPERTETN